MVVQICNQCARARPCEQCDGNCVVCKGVVPPGPKQLSPAALQAALRSEAASRACFGCGGCWTRLTGSESAEPESWVAGLRWTALQVLPFVVLVVLLLSHRLASACEWRRAAWVFQGDAFG